MARVFNNRILLFIIAVLLISNIGMLVFWYSMERGDRKPRGDMGWSPMSTFLQKKIGFNESQMKEFELKRSEHRRRLKPMFEDLKLAKINFYRLLNKANSPDTLISSEASVIGNMQKAVDFQTFKNFRELREICTDQQRPVYDSLIPGMISDMWFPNRKGMERPKK